LSVNMGFRGIGSYSVGFRKGHVWHWRALEASFATSRECSPFAGTCQIG